VARLKTISDLLREELGIATYERESALQAGVASAALMRQNPNRVAFVLYNLSANVLYVRPGAAASSTAGIRLGPNGGAISLYYREDFTLVSRDWQILASAAASDYYLLEIFLLGGEAAP
jgi:hypothetical protein